MQNPKIHQNQINNCDTPAEDLFDIYEKSRSVKDFQKLYNRGIDLHEIRGNKWVKTDFFDLRSEHTLIKCYDIIDGKMTFTKIGVYEIKNREVN